MWVGFLLNRVWVGSVWSPHCGWVECVWCVVCGVCGWVECGLDQVVGVLSSAINNSAQHREIMMCNTHSGWEECGLDQVLGAAHFTDCELHFALSWTPNYFIWYKYKIKSHSNTCICIIFHLIQLQDNEQYKCPTIKIFKQFNAQFGIKNTPEQLFNQINPFLESVFPPK